MKLIDCVFFHFSIFGISSRNLYLKRIYIAIIFLTLSVVSSYVSSGSCGNSLPTTLQSLSIFCSLKIILARSLVNKIYFVFTISKALTIAFFFINTCSNHRSFLAVELYLLAKHPRVVCS